MVDFNEALKVKVDSIEKPPLPPLGHYHWSITKRAYDTIADGKFDVVDFTCKAIGIEEDVDPDELSEYGGIGALTLRHRFMFNKGNEEADQANFKRTLFNIKRFLTEHCQLEADDDTDLAQLIDQSVGAKFLAPVQYRQDKNDPEVQYPEIGKTAPMD